VFFINRIVVLILWIGLFKVFIPFAILLLLSHPPNPKTHFIKNKKQKKHASISTSNIHHHPQKQEQVFLKKQVL